MGLTDEQFEQLKTLNSFLEQSFKGASIGPYQVDEMRDTLTEAISILEIFHD